MMKKILIILSIHLSMVAFAQESEVKPDNPTTTYYLIRHAEKDISNPSNNNPSISAKGLERATKWASIFEKVDFDVIYSTNYNRTKETAKPISESKNLKTTLYDLGGFDFEKFKAETVGKTVLIVGHSNTTPMFANAFIGEKKYEQIDEDNYANLYIITLLNGNVVFHQNLIIK